MTQRSEETSAAANKVNTMTFKLVTISLVIFVVLTSGKGSLGDENVKNVDYYEGKYTYCCLLREDEWNVKKVVLNMTARST